MTEKKESRSNYKGFVAGVFSGIAKLTGMSSSHFYNSILHFQAERLQSQDGRYARSCRNT